MIPLAFAILRLKKNPTYLCIVFQAHPIPSAIVWSSKAESSKEKNGLVGGGGLFILTVSKESLSIKVGKTKGSVHSSRHVRPLLVHMATGEAKAT